MKAQQFSARIVGRWVALIPEREEFGRGVPAIKTAADDCRRRKVGDDGKRNKQAGLAKENLV